MRTRVASAVALAAVLLVSGALWWRNHDILSDLYDYSSIIAAAGRIEAGLRPYVDFRSSMQSATYFLNWAAELVGGPSYLGLTRGALLFILGGASVAFALWRRGLGASLSLALVAAVAWAALAQHVVIFYNPIGILCLGLAVIGTAQEPRLWRIRSPEVVLIWAAFVLGGMNKLNFQALAIALAGLLILLTAVNARWRTRELLKALGSLALAGVVVPFGLEWLWTGAGPAAWAENVVGLAGERVDYMRRIADVSVFWKPAHDLYAHIPFRFLTPAGLLMLLAVAVHVARSIPHQERSHNWWQLLVLCAYTVAAAIGGVLLTITNVETITLTALAFPLSAAALLATQPARGSERISRLLAVFAGLWAINGAVAAWHGSRVMFGRTQVERESFVRLEAPVGTLRYLHGVRLDAGLHRMLRVVERDLQRIEHHHGDLRSVLFGPTFEWLERAHPEAIHRGLPIWYHLGTSLRAEDGPWLATMIERESIARLLADPDWESWPMEFQAYLLDHFRAVPLDRARLYERIGSEVPSNTRADYLSSDVLQTLAATESNIHLLRTSLFGRHRFFTSPWGECVGPVEGTEWIWDHGLSLVEGAIIVQRPAPEPTALRVELTAADPDEGSVVWRSAIMIPAGQTSARALFSATPYGRALHFKAVPVENITGLSAGFRGIRISQTVEENDVLPAPALIMSAPRSITLADGAPAIVRGAVDSMLHENLWSSLPFEAWRPVAQAGQWQVELELGEAENPIGSPPVVMLFWSRLGRLDLLGQHGVHPDDSGVARVQGWTAERGGWMGIIVRPAEAGRPLSRAVRIKQWTN